MSSPEKLRALAAFHREGTIQGAAEALGKSTSAVNYLLNALEKDAGVPLIDRSDYRNRLNAAGEAVLALGGNLLRAESDLEKLFARLKDGFEPRLHLIYDGVLDATEIVRALEFVRASGVTTRLLSTAAYHDHVEKEFQQLNADMMITVEPAAKTSLPHALLAPFKLFLVAAAGHPLACHAGRIELEELRGHTLITVRGSSSRLGLSTAALEADSDFTVGDFASKKLLIERGMGFGWLPEHLIKPELQERKLAILNTVIANYHVLSPRLYHQPETALGKSALLLRRLFTEGFPAPCLWETESHRERKNPVAPLSCRS